MTERRDCNSLPIPFSLRFSTFTSGSQGMTVGKNQGPEGSLVTHRSTSPLRGTSGG